jgi:predicted membrane metal-binding protein
MNSKACSILTLERKVLFISSRSLRAEKKRRLCFYFCGFNVVIIAGIFAVIANRLFWRRYGAWVTIVGIAAYTRLVGASASVVRAAIMGGLALTAHALLLMLIIRKCVSTAFCQVLPLLCLSQHSYL